MHGWKTCLRNHADGIASIDSLVVPTLSFRLLYGLLIPITASTPNLMAGRDGASDGRVDRPATSEACRWEPVPRYIIRDRDSVYGEVFKRRLRAMGIRPNRPPYRDRHGRMDIRND